MIKTSKRLKNLAMSEQGAGVFDLDAFYSEVVNASSGQMSIVYPQRLDLRHNSTYFLPFSRQSFYSSMMPISMNTTFINPTSRASAILSHFYDFSILQQMSKQEDSENSDSVEMETEQKLRLLEECLILDITYSERVWPHFANIILTLISEDKRPCRTLSAKNLEIKVSFIV